MSSHAQPGPRAARSWALSPQPILRIEAAAQSAAPIFGTVASVAPLPGGRLAVADPALFRITVIGADGSIERTFGSRGAGPGELRSIRWLRNCGGDSLWVWDPQSLRFSVFTAAGRFVRAWQATAPFAIVECAGNGQLFTADYFAGLTAPGAGPRVWYRSDFAWRDNGGKALSRSPNRLLGEIAPLARTTKMALLPGHALVAENAEPSVTILSPELQTERIVKLPLQPRAPTRREFDDAIERQIAPIADVAARARLRQQLSALSPPATMPFVQALFPIDDSTFAVHVTGEDADVTSVLFFAVGGQQLGSVELPAKGRLLMLTADRVAVVREDEDGGVALLVWKLSRK